MSNKTRATLQSEINSNITTNGSNEISGAKVRQRMSDIIDSFPNLTDDAEKLGLKVYNPDKSYAPGDTCLESDILYKCTTITTGTFNVSHWTATGSSTKSFAFNGNKFQSPLSVTVNGGNTGITLVDNPPANCRIDIFVNGELLHCGDGDKTKDFYLSSDSGATSKSFANTNTGDELYFNALIVGWNLETSDKISIHYEKIQ